MPKYSKKTQKTVATAMRKYKKGKLRSGKSKKKVVARKQAIAIGLSEARAKGEKAPKPQPKNVIRKKATPKKVTTKKRITKIKK